MLHRVSTSTLVKVALGGSVVCLGTAIAWMERVQAKVRTSDPFKDAMRLFWGYKAGKDVLGEPINVARMDLTSGGPNRITGTRSQIVIPLKGKKNDGRIYAYSSRENITTKWSVDRLDLEVDKPNVYKWTFYKGDGFDKAPYDFEKLKAELNDQTKLKS